MNDEATWSLAEATKSHGFQQPIVVDRDAMIMRGHGWLEVAKLPELPELKKVPVHTVRLE